jgi:hypothetical protein
MKTAVHAVADAASGPSPSAAPGQSSVTDSATAAATAVEEGVPGQSAPRPAGAVWVRFVLRYALIGLVGYAIFKSSFVSLGAFFLGLFLFIAAILAEIVYEIYRAFRGE